MGSQSVSSKYPTSAEDIPLKVPILLSVIAFIGCSAVLSSLDSGGTEQVSGEFYDESLPAITTGPGLGRIGTARRTHGIENGTVPSFHFALNRPRFIRYFYLDTRGGPVRNLDIYTRLNDTETWKWVKEIKSPVKPTTRIDLNIRASEIRVIQKTLSLRRESDEMITGFKVYAQKERSQ